MLYTGADTVSVSGFSEISVNYLKRSKSVDKYVLWMYYLYLCGVNTTLSSK